MNNRGRLRRFQEFNTCILH